MVRHICLALSGITLSLFVTALPQVRAADDSKSAELKKFSGEWKCVSGERKKEQMPEELMKGLKFVFTGNKLTLAAGPRKTNFTFKIDTKKKPKQFIMAAVDGRFKGKSATGIYAWKGTKLQLCIPNRPNEDKDPPKEFSTSEDEDVALLVLEKVEQKPKK